MSASADGSCRIPGKVRSGVAWLPRARVGGSLTPARLSPPPPEIFDLRGGGRNRRARGGGRASASPGDRFGNPRLHTLAHCAGLRDEQAQAEGGVITRVHGPGSAGSRAFTPPAPQTSWPARDTAASSSVSVWIERFAAALPNARGNPRTAGSGPGRFDSPSPSNPPAPEPARRANCGAVPCRLSSPLFISGLDGAPRGRLRTHLCGIGKARAWRTTT
jgi:hypothetical protein